MNAPNSEGGSGPPAEIARQTDASLLASLHAACAEEFWGTPAMARLLGLPETAAFTAARGAEPCGLILVRRAGKNCEILTIGVAPALRVQGIGAALLDVACDWGSRIATRRMVLEVASDNRAALRLYDKCGFEKCGRRPGYYDGTPRRDALILQRPLDGRGGGGLAIGEHRHI